MVPRLLVRLALIVPLVAAIAVACEHAGPTGPLGSLAVLNVTPNPQSLVAVTGTQTFTATGADASGNVVPVPPGLVWSTVAGGGTIVAGTGAFTAGSVTGTFANTVKATSGSISGFATVLVTSGGLASITVIPNPTTMVTSTAQTFSAVGRDASGNLVTISPAPTWSVAAGHAGGTVVAATGAYTAPAAVGPGLDTVKATSGAIVGVARVNIIPGPLVLATITVTPNPSNLVTGGTQQFTATGYDVNGVVVTIAPAPTWSVNAAVGGGSIVAGTGLFTAGGVTGTFTNTVKATSGSVSGVATVIVSNAVVGFPLGTAATYGILGGSAVTCAGAPGTINADVGNWPGTALTGFPPCTITGTQHIGDAVAQTAQGDLTSAFNAVAAQACGTTITADLGGTTLAEGVYCSLSSVGVTGTVTLTGTANSVFVIRTGVGSTLTTAGNVVMAGGAQAKNVYWWVGSSATLGTGSQWQGNILSLQSITLAGNVTLTGRALARNGAVSLNGTNNTITLP